MKTGKNSNPGTKAKPYETIQYGIDQVRDALKKGGAKPGEVLIEEGVYDEHLTLYDDIDLKRADGKAEVTIDVAKGTYKTSGLTGTVEISRSKKSGPLITISGVKRASIKGLKIDGHTKGGRGIDIYKSSDITINDCLIWNHWAEVDYGGKEKGTQADPYNGESDVKDSSNGAGIRIRESKTIDIDGNFFSNNRCDLKYSIPSPFDIAKLPSKIKIEMSGASKTLDRDCVTRYLRSNPEVYRNGGGAIFVENSKGVNVQGNLFTGNKAARGGAVRYGNKAYEWIQENYFSDNEAWVDGGAIAIWDYDREDVSRKPILIKECQFVTNTSADDGGAVYLTANTFARVEKCTFSGNQSGSNGGALRVTFGSRVWVKESVFIGNVANTDADTKVSDNKDGGGAVAVQNADLYLKKCTFTGNTVRGFAGGAIYANTVKYDPIYESIGKQVYGDNFDKLLKEKYHFAYVELELDGCVFTSNSGKGKTCYESKLSDDDKLEAYYAEGCDDLLEVFAKLEKKKQCVLPNGKGMTEGGAGGALYILEEKSGYLPMEVLIKDSFFNFDISEHNKKELRAAIVAIECRKFELGNVAISISAPTVYKLALENVTMTNVASSGLALTCSNSKVSTTDSEIRLQGVRCQ